LNIDFVNRNLHLASMVNYGGNTGNTIQVDFYDKSRQIYDAKNVGISTLILEESMRKKFEALFDESNATTQTLLPLNDDNGKLRDEIVIWLNALKQTVVQTAPEA